MIKVLNSIEEYRKEDAISYSKLSMCARAPWELVQEKQPPGPAMLFGSAVDILLQPGNKFEEEFVVLDTILPDKITILGKIINVLWTMQDMSVESIEVALNAVNAKQLKIEKAIEEVEPWKQKFELLKLAQESGKKVISSEQYNAVTQVVSTLLSNPWCSEYFQETKENQVFYQLPLVFEIDRGAYKTLPDLTIVNHTNKTVQSIDIKTTEKLYDFYESYTKYRYDIQECLHEIGTLYYKQEFYPDYTVLPTEFLVASKNSPGKILRFYTEELNAFLRVEEGWVTKYGRRMRGIKQLTDDLRWYEANGYNEKRELVENKGLVKLEI
jgi:hypothetical protein